MKTCDEMINSLFKRREQYLAEQKRRRKSAAITAALYCCAFAAVAGVGVWIAGKVSQKPNIVDSSVINPGSASAVADASSDLSIAWADSADPSPVSSNSRKFKEWNGKRISEDLYNALNKDNSDCLFAVEAWRFSIDKQFVYNGKTLAEYELEKISKWNELESKFFLNDLLAHAASEYGVNWSKDIYDKIVNDIGVDVDIINEYIVDGVFQKAKALQDLTKYEDNYDAANQSYEQALKAYSNHMYETIGGMLKAKGIKYEFKDYNNLILFISKEDFAELTFDNIDDWRFLHAYNNQEQSESDTEINE